MKIALASDLHLEFGPLLVKNTENADVLLLAGDILVAEDLYHFKANNLVYDGQSRLAMKHTGYVNFFTSVCQEFNRVIWIPGNHEHYHGNIIRTRGFAEAFLAEYGFGNVQYMDREVVEIDGFTFVAGTLWTNLKHRDPIVMSAVVNYMNDYNDVMNGPRKMIPRDTVEFHEEMLVLIKDTLQKANKVVVVGHHAPSTLSVHPRYQTPQMEPINWAYSSDLSEFILDNPKIKLWVHGHVHDEFDYMIGNTRIACNPRGYIGYEKRAEYYKLQYIEL